MVAKDRPWDRPLPPPAHLTEPRVSSPLVSSPRRHISRLVASLFVAPHPSYFSLQLGPGKLLRVKLAGIGAKLSPPRRLAECEWRGPAPVCATALQRGRALDSVAQQLA